MKYLTIFDIQEKPYIFRGIHEKFEIYVYQEPTTTERNDFKQLQSIKQCKCIFNGEAHYAIPNLKCSINSHLCEELDKKTVYMLLSFAAPKWKHVYYVFKRYQ